MQCKCVYHDLLGGGLQRVSKNKVVKKVARSWGRQHSREGRVCA